MDACGSLPQPDAIRSGEPQLPPSPARMQKVWLDTATIKGLSEHALNADREQWSPGKEAAAAAVKMLSARQPLQYPLLLALKRKLLSRYYTCKDAQEDMGGGGEAFGRRRCRASKHASLLPSPRPPFSLREAIPPRLLPRPPPSPVSKAGGSYLPSIQGVPAERLPRPLRPSPGCFLLPGCPAALTLVWLAPSAVYR